MTQREAIEQFLKMIFSAIEADPEMERCREAMAASGVCLHGIDVQLDVTLSKPQATPQSDQDFLRSLRIDPDLEVRRDP